MRLPDVVDAYLTRQRSLGMRFDSAGQLLHRFSRTIGDQPIQEVTPEAILDFLNGRGALTATWALKYRVLTGLYRFAISRGYVDNSPLPTILPKLPPQQTPYVYSTDQLRRLLEATAILRTGHSRQVPAMYRTLLLLLYGTGMRIGEAFEDGAIRASSRCSSTCAELPVSNAPSTNRARRACMIFATPRPCTVSLHGIAPTRTSSDCFRSLLPTLAISTSDRPSITSE